MSGKVISGNITYDQDEGFWHNIWNKLSDIASGIGHVAATVAPYAAAGLSAAARQYGNTPSSPSADFRRPVKTLVSYLPPQQPVTLLPEILPTTRLPLDFIPEPLKQAERPKQSYWPSANPEAWETPARQAMQALSASSNFSQEAQRPLQKIPAAPIPNPLHTAPMTDTIAPATLPPATYTDHYHMQTDLWPKVQTGEMLSDAEMKQLFHSIDLHRYGAQSQAQHMQADAAQAYAEQKLAEAMIRNALRTPTGEVLFSRVPIASQDALKVALQDVRHFQKRTCISRRGK